MSELEHFRLKSDDLGRMTGVNLAVHAVSDGFLLMHCGVGCKHKTTSKLSSHDWARSVVERKAWTEVGDAELIEGSADRIGPYLRTWHERLNPGLMVVISVTFLDLTGDDYKDTVRKAGEGLPCEVMYVSAPGTSGDEMDGYARVVVEVARALDWTAPVTRKNAVAILGHFFDRYEGDHLGNLVQLRVLLKALGLELGPVLFSGSTMDELRPAPACGTLLAFPTVHKKVRRLKRICKREPTAVDLPMGIRGTGRWLREVGAAAGVDPRRVEHVIAHKEERLRDSLGMARGALAGQRVAVFADLPLLAGICGVLDDLGMRPTLLGIRGHTLGGEAELRALLDKDGIAVDAEVLENPSIRAVRDSVRDRLEDDALDGIIGSATDFNGITTLPPGTFVRTDRHGDPVGRGPFALEAGFPCRHHHVIRSAPYLGYTGVQVWADRLLNAPRLWDPGRQ